jgi:hypothetical protein
MGALATTFTLQLGGGTRAGRGLTEADAIELLSARWVAQWGALQPGVPYALENEGFRSSLPAWALVFFRHTTSRQMTMGPPGGRRFERKGNIIVLLFGAIDVGRQPLSLLVADVRTVFEAKRLNLVSDPLWTYAATSVEGGKNGKTTDGEWFQQNVTIPFMYTELA